MPFQCSYNQPEGPQCNVWGRGMAAPVLLLFFAFEYSGPSTRNQADIFFGLSNLSNELFVLYLNPRYDGGRFRLSPQKASAFYFFPDQISTTPPKFRPALCWIADRVPAYSGPTPSKSAVLR